MPLWASGLATGLEPHGADWIAHGTLGSVKVSFVPANEFGVIDHTVTIESGLRVYNALRIVPNGDGCEVMREASTTNTTESPSWAARSAAVPLPSAAPSKSPIIASMTRMRSPER